jgi:hypothetical protein
MLGEKLGQALTFVVDGVFKLMNNLDKAAPIFELIGSIWSNILSPALSVAFDIIVKLAEALGPIVEVLGPAMSTIFEGLATVITNIVIPAFNTIIDTITIVVDKIKGMINWISEGLAKISEFGAGIGDKFTGGWDAVKGLVSGIDIPFFAKGGRLASGEVGVVGEAGPELITGPAKITPLNKSPLDGAGVNGISGMSSSQSNSNIIFNVKNVNAGGNMGELKGKAMKKYIEGISMQVATKLLRQNQGYGGLI